MEDNIKKQLNYIKKELNREREYIHAATIIEFDQMTVCPPEGQEMQGDSAVRVSNHAFRIRKSAKFIECVKALYEEIESLDEYDKILVEELYRTYIHDKNVTPELFDEFARTGNNAWVAWSKAREKEDVSGFLPELNKVIESKKKYISIAGKMPDEEKLSDYEFLLNAYESGMDEKTLDELFKVSKDGICELLKKIGNSNKTIRTDFLKRPVRDSQQAEMARYLMEILGFDFEKGQMAVSEHPFTSLVSENDVRITTHYYSDNFISNIYSVIHECGHALFEQLLPREDHKYFIEEKKSMGMHESVSRFFENIIGRSKEFITLIYPKVCEIFPQVMRDVTVDELYEAVNYVCPSLIRTEADELTYTLHIIIRYELEKKLISGELSVNDLSDEWSRLYKEYLGVKPSKDSEGLLQDVHWTTDFGYFPTYALGNFYGAMFLKKMMEEFDPFQAVAEGDFGKINEWMAENVYKKANILKPTDWIQDITGRKVCAEDFINYLNDKYTHVYDLGNNDQMQSGSTEYVKRIRRIRKLSSPSLEEIKTSKEYSELLRNNFEEIGKIAADNRMIIENCVRPLLSYDKCFSKEVFANFKDFCYKLTDPNSGKNLDASLAFSISVRLADDAKKSGDDEYYIEALDMLIANAYLMVNQTMRLTACPEVPEYFRNKGLEAFYEIIKYLDKEKFVKLSDELKRIVLIDSRYGPVLYEHLRESEGAAEMSRKRIALIEDSIRIAMDPFYREAFPDYTWDKHILKCYEYIMIIGADRCEPELVSTLKKYANLTAEYGRSCTEVYEKVFPYEYIYEITEGIRYAAGECTREDHMKRMYTIWSFADKHEYNRNGGDNLIASLAYIDAARDGELSENMKSNIRDMYNEIASYAFRIPMMEWISSVLGIYSAILLRFMEIPGGITFEEFGLKVMAGFHPPTYIHSIMVARIAVCIAEYLMKASPELFVGVLGCPSAEALPEYKDEILNYTHHAAMCHDFGKLIIIDTVFVYGRNLLPSEMPIIRSHSLMGWELLRKNDSTKAYADVAAGHHAYYDRSEGYPDSFDMDKSPVKTIIDIICVADCMDAATDEIGRSYSVGKTLDEFIGEVKAGAGKRYSPFVAKVLDDEGLYGDLEYLLDKGRKKVYKETFKLLRSLQGEDFSE